MASLIEVILLFDLLGSPLYRRFPAVMTISIQLLEIAVILLPFDWQQKSHSAVV